MVGGNSRPAGQAKQGPTARTKPLADSCAGAGTRLISAGQSNTLRIEILRKGMYEYLCTVPGRAAGGMKGLVTVN